MSFSGLFGSNNSLSADEQRKNEASRAARMGRAAAPVDASAAAPVAAPVAASATSAPSYPTEMAELQARYDKDIQIINGKDMGVGEREDALKKRKREFQDAQRALGVKHGLRGGRGRRTRGRRSRKSRSRRSRKTSRRKH